MNQQELIASGGTIIAKIEAVLGPSFKPKRNDPDQGRRWDWDCPGCVDTDDAFAYQHAVFVDYWGTFEYDETKPKPVVPIADYVDVMATALRRYDMDAVRTQWLCRIVVSRPEDDAARTTTGPTGNTNATTGNTTAEQENKSAAH